MTRMRCFSELLTNVKDSPSDEVDGSSVPTSSLKDTLADITDNTQHYPLLFRATNGHSDKKKKVKFTTVVTTDDIDEFWVQYTEVVKTGMTGLKKKDKKKKQKAKKVKKTSDDA